MAANRRQRYETAYLHFDGTDVLRKLQRHITTLNPSRNLNITILPKGLTMARNNAFTQVTFCNIRLTEAAKKDFKKWAGSDEYDLDALLTHIVDAENKISMSYDNKNATYLVSMTCKDATSQNNDCCIVSRAPTLPQAIAVMLYKFYILLPELSWRDYAAEEDWG